MNWYEYPICVPFGNPNYDAAYGGAHDMDVRTPPNTPITALLDGKIVDLSAPSWGKQVGVQISGHSAPYMAYLHLAAIHPGLAIGSNVKKGQIIGWSGGCTEASQYSGTSNPTGQNFLNAPSQSSQPQTGIALMHGPVYGSGSGWVQFPPVDWSLNPTSLIEEAIKEAQAPAPQVDYKTPALQQMFCIMLPAVRTGTGIEASWMQKAAAGVFYGPAITQEITGGKTWNGADCIRQFFLGGWCEWVAGVAYWYKYE